MPTKQKPAAPRNDWPAYNVENWPITKLRPDSRNARRHSTGQVDQIAAAMKEWGWTMPILADEDGRVIAGHGRLQAARRSGFTEAPVIVARGWSEAQKRAYMLADNKLTENSSWDTELLRIELMELRASDFDLSLTGFDMAEIGTHLRSLEDVVGPEDFKGFGEDIETEHECPKCGYRWS
jgi:ParB-like chromosome segregation protein Spo0J